MSQDNLSERFARILETVETMQKKQEELEKQCEYFKSIFEYMYKVSWDKVKNEAKKQNAIHKG